jgi:hypothetical protein
MGWHRYSRLELLAQKISDIAQPVMFHTNDHIEPFSIVRMRDFDFINVQQCAKIGVPGSTPFNNAELRDIVLYDEDFEDLQEPDSLAIVHVRRCFCCSVLEITDCVLGE